jgi:hypothetical protein
MEESSMSQKISQRKEREMNSKTFHVLVKNFNGINEDVEVFEHEHEALEAFKKYTGFEWNPHYTDPASDHYDEKFSETKIFNVQLRMKDSKKKGD